MTSTGLSNSMHRDSYAHVSMCRIFYFTIIFIVLSLLSLTERWSRPYLGTNLFPFFSCGINTEIRVLHEYSGINVHDAHRKWRNSLVSIL